MENDRLKKYERRYKLEIETLRKIGKTEDEIYQDIKKLSEKEERKKVANLIEVVKKRPSALDNTKAMMDYRTLRILQVHYADELQKAREFSFGGPSDLDIDYMKEKCFNLDRDRRETHNRALSNFCSLMNKYHDCKILPFHTGKYMDPYYEPDKYGDHRLRCDMTDSMFDLLNAIENVNIRELMVEQQENKVEEIHKDLNRETRGYGIVLNGDDGDVSRI